MCSSLVRQVTKRKVFYLRAKRCRKSPLSLCKYFNDIKRINIEKVFRCSIVIYVCIEATIIHETHHTPTEACGLIIIRLTK